MPITMVKFGLLSETLQALYHIECPHSYFHFSKPRSNYQLLRPSKPKLPQTRPRHRKKPVSKHHLLMACHLTSAHPGNPLESVLSYLTILFESGNAC